MKKHPLKGRVSTRASSQQAAKKLVSEKRKTRAVSTHLKTKKQA